ncbi:MAG: hypothetical protein ABFD66_02635 [Smithella sp.]
MRYSFLHLTIIFSIILVSAILSGCSTNQGSSFPEGEGFSDITPREDSERVRLVDALTALDDLYSSEGRNSSLIHIYYIGGVSIDSKGSADRWWIGGREDQNPFFFVYSANGYKILHYNGILPSQEINPDNVLSPEELFRQRPLLIQDLTNGGEREISALEIREGSYIMTCHSDNKVRVFFFDAVTGIETSQK